MPAHRAAALATVALTATLLAGCVGGPGAMVPPPAIPPTRALYEVLAADGEAIAELQDSVEASAAASGALIDEIGAEIVERAGVVEYVPTAHGMAVPGLRTVIPGLDEPIVVTRTARDQSRQTPHGTLSESGRVEHTVADQTARFVLDHTTTLTHDGDRVAQDARQSNVTAPVCAANDEGTVTGEWTLERRVESTENGVTTRLEVSARATVSSGVEPSSPMTIDDFEVRATRTTTTNGESTVDRGTFGGRFESWGSEVVPTEAEWSTLRDARGEGDSEWFEAEIPRLLLGTLGASTHEFVAVVRTALEARQSSGLCVRIEFDTGGVTTLGDGDSATIVARVVDSRSGDAVDAAIAATTYDGSVTPDTAPSPATFTFTASGSDATKRVFLDTSSPRGGDSAEVVFTTGWHFEGVELSISTEGYTGYQVWSGYVCGDPFTEEWHFTQIVDDFVVEYDLVVPALGTRLNAEWGQQPMIERVSHPADGEPPFRLYIDDVEPPEVSPRTQRVQVPVREGAAACD